MKYFAVLVILTGLAFPVFSQNAAITRRFNTLSESMETTISKSSTTLADFNSQITDNGEINVYSTYLRKYNSLATSLQESESKLNLLLRTNDRTVYVIEERDNYGDLIKQLQSVKSEFDTYLRSR
jgi:hypothetical protein